MLTPNDYTFKNGDLVKLDWGIRHQVQPGRRRRGEVFMVICAEYIEHGDYFLLHVVCASGVLKLYDIEVTHLTEREP